jgi:mannan endo-1,4-beta-mannosidase
MKHIAVLLITIVALSACAKQEKNSFITIKGHQFYKNGEPYYYIGANYWYGAILGSEGAYGNRERLLEELDLMKGHGIDNLRILAGAEGPDGEPRRVTPTLQTEQGKYSEDQLKGLDFLLAEMAKRDMVAILYLNNSWEWSGGYAQYLNWNGYGDIPYPLWEGHTWPEFMEYTKQFHQCDECKEQFFEHVKFMLERTNSYTGTPYTDDPTIMAWELGNEPRAFSDENIPAFIEFLHQTASFIQATDTNHLVTTGTEGYHGCRRNWQLFDTIHNSENIDYLTMHVWPLNWGWLDVNNMNGTLGLCINNTLDYMDQHITKAKKFNKPIVYEEFGFPRDGFSFSHDAPTTARDRYYNAAFDLIYKNAQGNGPLAGANFWTFSGTGRPSKNDDDHFWEPGEDIIGDPPQEEQGLNSVFPTDSTMNVIKHYNQLLGRIK